MTTPPIEHAPSDLTGWVKLGEVTAGHCPIAIVAADAAADLQKHWQQRRDAANKVFSWAERSELLMTGSQQSEEIDGIGGENESAVMFSSPEMPASGVVYGRFGDLYDSGRMSLVELRVRLWKCQCVCHDDPDADLDEWFECAGDCCTEGDDLDDLGDLT